MNLIFLSLFLKNYQIIYNAENLLSNNLIENLYQSYLVFKNSFLVFKQQNYFKSKISKLLEEEILEKSRIEIREV
jgi:hypothetical protein